MAIELKRRRFLVRRLPLFAAIWLPSTLVWSLVVMVEGLIGPLEAAALPALCALILAGAFAVCRTSPESPRVAPVVLGMCIFLGVAMVVVFAVLRGNGDFLAYVLLTLYLLTALLFGWGWRAELTLWTVTVGAWLLAIPTLRFHLPTIELVAAILTGSAISFVVAEGSARALALTLRHRAADEQSRRQLEASRNAYRDLAEQAHEPIFAADLAGHLTYVNAAMARALGQPPETLLGRDVVDFLSDHPANAELPALLAGCLEAERPLPLVGFEVSTTRGSRWFETMPSATHDAGGLVTGLRAICRDVTERKELECQREAVIAAEQAARIAAEGARGEAQAAARARDEFLAMLSHELRSPLHVVLGWVGLLRKGLLPETKTPQALATIEEAARTQSRLVEDLLDISRVTAGKFGLQLDEVDLCELLAARVDAARESARHEEVELEAQLDRSAGLVRGDRTRLLQVFDNLVSNAIKFTPPGGRVTVTLERVDGEAQVTVRDTGMGIPPEVLPHVFEQFHQADSSITRRYGGLGLGLSIARRLIELHGGHIAAQSPGEGGGATFCVRLPVAGPAPLRPQEPTSPPRRSTLERVRVVVVDDEPAARQLLTALLAGFGAEVRTAASTREALEHVKASAPDVLVTDLAMPGEDGYTLLRSLRASGHGRRIPAIALTALASPEERARAMAEGFAEHLPKPVDPEQLVDAVARSLRPA